MHAIRLTTLVILSLLLSDAWAHAMGRPVRRVRWVTSSAAAPRVAVIQSRVMEQSLSWTFRGWGQTREDAEENALKRAQEKIFEYFAERDQPLERAPDREYIKRHMVKERQTVAPRDFGDPVGELQGVQLRVETAPADWQYLLHEDRRVRAESRMLVLAKLFAGLVAALGAVAGYLRLEEMTKGYYTAWLRLAAIGFVTAVGVGIWWTC